MLRFLRRVRALVWRTRLDRDLREELAQHVEWKAQSYIASGVCDAEARRRAAVDVGNITRLREDARAMWGFPTADSLLQDLVYGARLLRRSRAFTVTSVLSLAIGIGATAAVFSLAEVVLVRELPVADPGSLFVVKWQSGAVFPFASLNGTAQENDSGLASTSFSYAAYDTFRADAANVVDVLGFADLYQINLAGDGHAEVATAHAVSGNYFDVLGLAPAAGRALSAFDDRDGAAPAAIVSGSLAIRRFGGAAAAVGRRVTINSVPFTIVGVLPAAFHGTGQVGTNPDVYVPLAMKARVVPGDDPPRDPNFWWVLMMARLKPGVHPDAVRDALDVLLKRTVAVAKPALAAKDFPRITLLPGGRGQVEDRREMQDPLETMAGVTTLVLLVACANVAGLLLARGRARIRELSVRTAIGAARSRIIRQLVTEALMIAAAGAGFGLVLARWLTETLAPALSTTLEESGSLGGLDLRLVLFAAAVGCACAMVFGLLPAFRATKLDVNATLQDGGRGTISQRRLLSGSLVVVQIAISLLLVAGAGLLVRSLGNLEHADLGFDPSNLLLFRVDPFLNGYEGRRAITLYAQILNRARATPGVTAASLSSHQLISNSSTISTASRPDDHSPAPDSADARAFDRSHRVWSLTVDEKFFSTLAMPLLRGRTFELADERSAPVVIVNRSLARQLYGTDDVVGREVALGFQKRPNAAPMHIIGVVGDARYTAIRDPKPPTAYLFYQQQPDVKNAPTFEIRTAGPPSALAATVRGIVREIDPNVPMFGIMSQSEQIGRSLQRERLFARLAVLLGCTAVMLSAIGIYGLLAYGVARRTREIGLRMALGAAQRTVRWMVLRESIVLVALGLVFGVPAAFAGTKILDSLLFGLDARDPFTLVAACLFMIALALTASYLPARRAARVDPMIALRAD
jgi:predicted permease